MTPEGWALETLGRLLREPIRNGYSPNCPPDASGRWILSLSAVTPYGFNSRGVKPAPREDPRVDESLLEPGDIVVSRSNTRDRVGLAGRYMGIPGPCSYPDLLMRVRPDGSLHPAFLVCCLLSQNGREYFRRSARGTSGSMVKIDRRILEDFPVPLPPLPEQRKIAAILSSVDEAIETTQAVIGQLQVVKKAMMAELLTRGIPGRHTKFKMTEIGEVPEGWEVVRLSECVREPVRNGYSPVCPKAPTGRWMLHLGAVSSDGFNSSAVKHAPSDDPRVESAALEPGDILVSRSNTRERVGFAGLYCGTPSPCFYPDLLMRVRTSDRVIPEFLEAVLLSHRGREYLSCSARGTSGSMVKIKRDILLQFLVQVPSRQEQQEIIVALSLVSDRLATERGLNETQLGLKSALMSVLLTGELRVRPDSEAP